MISAIAVVTGPRDTHLVPTPQLGARTPRPRGRGGGMSRPVVAVLNGPNLNLLGQREPALYGHETLADVEESVPPHGGAPRLRGGPATRRTTRACSSTGCTKLRESAAGIVINAGAYTHTSIALRDALVTVAGPVVEVHLTNVHAREDFRQRSYLTGEVATAVIAGLGSAGYAAGVEYVATRASRTGGGVRMSTDRRRTCSGWWGTASAPR